ncbi:hypothetical protein FHG87_005396 [Trinorchestia longiramus]|nr:hypothetical protein FHG87_005396 [Trinorchestia longiramus]
MKPDSRSRHLLQNLDRIHNIIHGHLSVGDPSSSARDPSASVRDPSASARDVDAPLEKLKLQDCFIPQITSVSQSGPYRPPGGVEEMQRGNRRVRLEWGAYITV